MLAWSTQGDFRDILAQVFNADGTKRGGEFIVAGGIDLQDNVAVTATADGRIAFTFTQQAALDVSRTIMRVFDPRLQSIVLNGTGFADHYAGTIFADALTGDAGNDVLAGGTGDDTLNGDSGDDTLSGDEGNDVVNGGGGDDVLSGGQGFDRLAGGLGDDTYDIDQQDTIFEVDGFGIDTARGAFSMDLYQFTASIENLTALGSSAIQLKGDGGENTLDASLNAAANTLTGRGGSDTYRIGANDTVVEGFGPNGGVDTIIAGGFDINLSGAQHGGGNVENGTITSGGFDIVGNAFDNALNGELDALANFLQGGAGDDILRIGANDTVNGGSGSDWVSSSTLSLSLTTALPSIENAMLLGSLQGLNLVGNSSANRLTGNAAANDITGGRGPDILKGGGGNDDFVYTSRADSTPSQRDMILDFRRGDDIDLSDLAGKLRFVGTKEFSDRFREVRYERVGGDTRVEVDSNADGRADMVILLDRQMKLTKGDFIL